MTIRIDGADGLPDWTPPAETFEEVPEPRRSNLILFADGLSPIPDWWLKLLPRGPEGGPDGALLLTVTKAQAAAFINRRLFGLSLERALRPLGIDAAGIPINRRRLR